MNLKIKKGDSYEYEFDLEPYSWIGSDFQVSTSFVAKASRYGTTFFEKAVSWDDVGDRSSIPDVGRFTLESSDTSGLSTGDFYFEIVGRVSASEVHTLVFGTLKVE